MTTNRSDGRFQPARSSWRPTWPLAAVVAFLLPVSAALAQNIISQPRTVSFKLGEENIVGTLTEAAGETPSPVVLILHGTSGLRQGPRIRGDGSGLFVRTARFLAKRGIASLSISTRGRGGSDGDFHDMTIERRIDEAIRAIDWLSHQPAFDPRRIYVLGHSQGSIVAAAAAGRLERTNKLAGVVMWAPNTDPLRSYRNSMGPAVFEQGLRARPGEVVRWHGAGGKSRAFRSGFFKGLLDFNMMEEIAAYAGPILVVTGMRDRMSPPAGARVIARHHPGELIFVEFDVGHRMGANMGMAEVDMLAGNTAGWLERRKAR